MSSFAFVRVERDAHCRMWKGDLLDAWLPGVILRGDKEAEGVLLEEEGGLCKR
jgi:hypothetical protein